MERRSAFTLRSRASFSARVMLYTLLYLFIRPWNTWSVMLFFKNIWRILSVSVCENRKKTCENCFLAEMHLKGLLRSQAQLNFFFFFAVILVIFCLFIFGRRCLCQIKTEMELILLKSSQITFTVTLCNCFSWSSFQAHPNLSFGSRNVRHSPWEKPGSAFCPQLHLNPRRQPCLPHSSSWSQQPASVQRLKRKTRVSFGLTCHHFIWPLVSGPVHTGCSWEQKSVISLFWVHFKQDVEANNKDANPFQVSCTMCKHCHWR